MSSFCDTEARSPRSQWPIEGSCATDSNSCSKAEALNETEMKKSASRAYRSYSFLTSAQKYEAAEYGVTATIHHYGNKHPDLVLKESSVHRFKNAYQKRIKLNLECLSVRRITYCNSPKFSLATILCCMV